MRYKEDYLTAGWTYDNVRQRYLDLAQRLRVPTPIQTDLAAIQALPSTPERAKVKRLLWAISDGVMLGDKACIQIAVEFVAEPVYFYYSASIRSKMRTRLKQALLTAKQRQRLQSLQSDSTTINVV